MPRANTARTISGIVITAGDSWLALRLGRVGSRAGVACRSD